MASTKQQQPLAEHIDSALADLERILMMAKYTAAIPYPSEEVRLTR